MGMLWICVSTRLLNWEAGNRHRLLLKIGGILSDLSSMQLFTPIDHKILPNKYILVYNMITALK